MRSEKKIFIVGGEPISSRGGHPIINGVPPSIENGSPHLACWHKVAPRASALPVPLSAPKGEGLVRLVVDERIDAEPIEPLICRSSAASSVSRRSAIRD